MLEHSRGYQKSIMLIKTGRLNKQNNANMNRSEKRKSQWTLRTLHWMSLVP